jgi:toxin ParE1/3/4
MKLRYTARAIADLEAIADYLKPRSPQGLARVRATIRDGLKTIVQFPRAGRLQDAGGIRKLAVRKYKYLIYYTVEEDEIAIIAIQHGSRQRAFGDL